MSRPYWWKSAAVFLPLALWSVTAVCEEPAQPRQANSNVSNAVVREWTVVNGTTRIRVVNQNVQLAQNDAQVRQLVGQLNLLTIAELNLIRSACDDLTPTQRKAIKSAAVAEVEQLAKRMAVDQARPRQQLVVNGIAQLDPRQDVTDPVKEVRTAISRQLEMTLTDEQFRRWEQEFLGRNEDRKKASILMLISRIDSQLFLNEEQRTLIEKDLRAQWHDDWENWVEVITRYERSGYIPVVPNELILPHLTHDQQTVWNGLRRIKVNNAGLRNRRLLVDDPWWDEAVGSTDQPVSQAAP